MTDLGIVALEMAAAAVLCTGGLCMPFQRGLRALRVPHASRAMARPGRTFPIHRSFAGIAAAPAAFACLAHRAAPTGVRAGHPTTKHFTAVAALRPATIVQTGAPS
ncbi:hypothetical protein [Acidimangrovimonas sediminis]|uniref:hypothetical protein n=1 Tax=Acidimangrovimonas sediminis TaxID=2056283 RepID=UPI000C7FAF56|nr:hypothetical protein [Acidimangrovimonas sediminis]